MTPNLLFIIILSHYHIPTDKRCRLFHDNASDLAGKRAHRQQHYQQQQQHHQEQRQQKQQQ